MPRLLPVLFLLLGPVVTWADTWNSATRTHSHELESAALGETRTVLVRTPPSYHEGQRHPVVYVPDAEWNFELVASYLDYMADNDLFPDMIVTGVINVNRNRDFLPRPDPHFRDSGQAGRFLAFVRDEWVPFIGQNYRAGPQRVLIGHSFGGVITLHALFTEPELFDAYIALGASAWVSDRVLFEEAEAYFETHPEHAAFVYMAVGENDGGPTVPSSRDLAALFELHAPRTLEWTFDITPRTEHFKNVPSGMHDAFMALFPGWEFDEELARVARAGGGPAVERWFAEKSDALGWRFLPSWFDLGIVALTLVNEGHEGAAQAVTEGLRAHQPGNAVVAEFSGRVFERSGDPSSAAAEYRRALRLVREQDLHPNAQHAGDLEAALERVEQGED